MYAEYGNGSKGGKTDDLYQYGEMIARLGMKKPPGIVIKTDVFFQSMEEFHIAEDDPPEAFQCPCPECITEINKDILENRMDLNFPYAIRSSAVSERGGTGIYRTVFFVATGNREQDMERLWQKEREIYGSELSSDAKAWRKKTGGDIGMAILIQPVEGFIFENYCLPSLSGIAYTSYQGLPTVRVVIGMGTKAVKGGGMLYNSPPDSALEFQRNLRDQNKAEVIDLSTGKITEINSRYEEIYGIIEFGIFCNLFQKIKEMKAYGDFSMEWAIAGSSISIVQISACEDRLPVISDSVTDPKEYFLLAEGTDVLHSGKVFCEGVIYVNYWSKEAASVLENLNKQLKNYLLIVPQNAFSEISEIDLGISLRFSHFSNAKAVLEKQYPPPSFEMMKQLLQLGKVISDHTKGLGASHFQQLCKRSDILFLGCIFNSYSLINMEGWMPYSGGVSFLPVSAIVITNPDAKSGYAYVGKNPKKSLYSPNQIMEWCSAIRIAANKLDGPLSDFFFNVHYAMASCDNPMEFDPFKMDDDALQECGTDGIRKSIEIVMENISCIDIPPEGLSALEKYLKELLMHIA